MYAVVTVLLFFLTSFTYCFCMLFSFLPLPLLRNAKQKKSSPVHVLISNFSLIRLNRFLLSFYTVLCNRTNANDTHTHNIPDEMENLFVLYNKTQIKEEKKSGNNHKQQITNNFNRAKAEKSVRNTKAAKRRV